MKTILALLMCGYAFGQVPLPSPFNGAGGGGGSGVTSITAACGISASTNPIVATGTIKRSQAVNAQTGTTYIVLDGDCGKLVTQTNAASIVTTLPQANGSTFIAGWTVDIVNEGVGTVTITPTTSTIDGAATLTLTTSQGVRIVSDGTNYFSIRGRSSGDVAGPSSATDNACARFDGTTGKLIQNSTNCVIDDSGNLVVNSIATGATPPALTPGTGGAQACNEGTAPSVGPASGVDVVYCDSTAHTWLLSRNNGSYFPLGQVIFQGTLALGTSAIASADCATVATVSATGLLTTDVVTASFNGDPTAVTGYVPLTAGMLAIIVYPTANTINAKVCNSTSGSITPGAITLNVMAVRK